MKALLISEIFPPTHGGSGRWFWEIYRRLSVGEVVLMVGAHEKQASFDAKNPLETIRTPMRSNAWGIRSIAGLTYYWKLLLSAIKIKRKHGIESLHCGRCLPEGVIGLLMNLIFKIPYICYIHGEDIETAKLSREHTWIVNLVFKKTSFLIANSKNTASLLREEWGVSDIKIKVLHPGVDTNTFCPSETSQKKREALGWGDSKVVLTVGRLQERKGQDMMIRAMPKILKTIPDLLYCVAGDGSDLPRLKRLTEELNLVDKVQFKKEVEDDLLIDCYQQCDLFVLPNRRVGNDIEGFGMVLVEAQACGKAVVAGASGGTIETMVPGKTGIVIDCTSIETIVDSITDLLADDTKRRQMGSLARNHVVERFDWEKLSQRASAIFASI